MCRTCFPKGARFNIHHYMKQEFPKRPPHLKTIFRKFDPPLYFITFCTYGRRPVLATVVFHEHFRNYFEKKATKGIACGEYIIMPDHVHLFLRIDPHQYRLGTTVGFIKKSLSKPLLATGVVMPHWQDNFFDHLLRSPDSYSEKWEYVRRNAVRAGLVEHADDWPYQGRIVPIRY